MACIVSVVYCIALAHVGACMMIIAKESSGSKLNNKYTLALLGVFYSVACYYSGILYTGAEEKPELKCHFACFAVFYAVVFWITTVTERAPTEEELRQVAFSRKRKQTRARNVADASADTAVEPEAKEGRPRDTAVRRHNDAGAGIGAEDPTDAGEGGDEERRPLGIPRDELRRRVRGHVRDFRGELREVDAHKQFEQHRRHHNFPAQRGTNRAPSANHDQRLRKHLAHKNARVRAENYNGN